MDMQTCEDFEIQAAWIGSLYICMSTGTSKYLYLMQTWVMKLLRNY